MPPNGALRQRREYAEGLSSIPDPTAPTSAAEFAEPRPTRAIRQTTFTLGGLSSADEQNETVGEADDTKALALLNMADVLTDQKQLQEIGAESAGMQFAAARSTPAG